jgi:hypothetical protein
LDFHKTGIDHGLPGDEQEIVIWLDGAKLSLGS